MERWSIYCKKCGKFILTEEKDAHNEIHCVAGSMRMVTILVQKIHFIAMIVYQLLD